MAGDGDGDGDVGQVPPAAGEEPPERPEVAPPVLRDRVPHAEPAVVVDHLDALAADLGHLDAGRPVGADDPQLATGQPDLEFADVTVEGRTLWAGDLPPGHLSSVRSAGADAIHRNSRRDTSR